MLKRLGSERGTTTLMVTHDNRILDLADRIITMDEGRIIEDRAIGQANSIPRFRVFPAKDLIRHTKPNPRSSLDVIGSGVPPVKIAKSSSSTSPRFRSRRCGSIRLAARRAIASDVSIQSTGQGAILRIRFTRNGIVGAGQHNDVGPPAVLFDKAWLDFRPNRCLIDQTAAHVDFRQGRKPGTAHQM